MPARPRKTGQIRTMMVTHAEMSSSGEHFIHFLLQQAGNKPLCASAIGCIGWAEGFAKSFLLNGNPFQDSKCDWYDNRNHAEPVCEKDRQAEERKQEACVGGMPDIPVQASLYQGVVGMNGDIHGKQAAEAHNR